MSKKQPPDLALLANRVQNFARELAADRATAQTLGPRVMRAFRGMQKEVPEFTFLYFLRTLDPSIPEHAADRGKLQGYRNHPTYYAGWFLRRVVESTRHRYRDDNSGDECCAECGWPKGEHAYADVI